MGSDISLSKGSGDAGNVDTGNGKSKKVTKANKPKSAGNNNTMNSDRKSGTNSCSSSTTTTQTTTTTESDTFSSSNSNWNSGSAMDSSSYHRKAGLGQRGGSRINSNNINMDIRNWP